MLTRAIALSLALLVGIGALIPFATQETEAGPRKNRKNRRQAKHYKKYSKAWWRQYRARQKRKRALQAQRRALRLRQLRLARARAAGESTPNSIAAAKPIQTKKAETAMLPTGDPAPTGWKTAQATSSEIQFRVDNSAGDQVGSASISVVGPANPQSTMTRRAVGGVSTSSLRREVIDRMVKENGWVVNDYEKEIAGQPVYVVMAQSQAKNGTVQARMFYFTEVDGRIYSVATNSPVQQTERLAEESEKVINSLKSRVKPTLRASAKD
jgi:hypothetical protein